MTSVEWAAWAKSWPWPRIVGWVGVLSAVALFRRFVLVGLVTFALVWTVRRLVRAMPSRRAEDGPRPAVERGLTFTAFGAILVAAAVAWAVVVPPLYQQGRKLVTRLVEFDYQDDLDYFLARTVGSYLFHRKYGNETSPAYRDGLKSYRDGGGDGRGWYARFPVLEAGLVSGFESSHDHESLSKWRHADREAYRRSPEYLAAFAAYYDELRAGDRSNYPFDFGQFQELRSAYTHGKEAFTAVLAKTAVGADGDFVAAEEHRLARTWWASDPMALAVRQRLNDLVPVVLGDAEIWAADLVRAAVTVPVDLLTAFFLAVYVALDVHGLKRSAARWRTTTVGQIASAVGPDLRLLAEVFGLYFRARTWIAMFDAAAMALVLWLLGVENVALLAAIVFATSYVPYLGAVMAGVPIVLVAVIQPGGSAGLAVKAALAMTVVHLIESNVVSPILFARSVELHPIGVIVVLVLGEYFFGLWGLVFAVPVTVFVLRLTDSADSAISGATKLSGAAPAPGG